MAGYSKLYVVGGLGGHMGADGVNPIEFLVLVGDAGRQWLEPHYFDRYDRALGRVQTIVPAGPDHSDSLLDACIAFCPRNFKACPSIGEVEAAVRGADRLDFDGDPRESRVAGRDSERRQGLCSGPGISGEPISCRLPAGKRWKLPRESICRSSRTVS